ncbi:MAG: hypothetical protein A2Z25_21765 [Planctomycetes bacterium RBG_16_55_9]|nr:MAG: hypothetical protein A2Z25_21765 [Planctomycetes bacterium RBG_16_55_9]
MAFSAARPGFSLAEVLAALTIGAMVIVAILAIYHRAEQSAGAVMYKLEASQLTGEVLQYIAEDLDGMISSSSDAKVTIQNKLENAAGKLIPAAKLTITRTITDAQGQEHVFEEITWQSSYNIESLTEGLILYRSHSGINLEDKVLQQNKYDWERELLVPICSGVTFFDVSATAGDDLVDRWDSTVPPNGVAVTLSFAEPYKNIDGTYDVPEEAKITRTIAINRTRKIKFDIAGAGSGKGQADANQTDASIEKGLPADKSAPGKEGSSPSIRPVKPIEKRGRE